MISSRIPYVGCFGPDLKNHQEPFQRGFASPAAWRAWRPSRWLPWNRHRLWWQPGSQFHILKNEGEPSCYHLVMCYIAIENGWKWPIKIVDLPLKSGDFPQRCKRLLEGNHHVTIQFTRLPHSNGIKWQFLLGSRLPWARLEIQRTYPRTEAIFHYHLQTSNQVRLWVSQDQAPQSIQWQRIEPTGKHDSSSQICWSSLGVSLNKFLDTRSLPIIKLTPSISMKYLLQHGGLLHPSAPPKKKYCRGFGIVHDIHPAIHLLPRFGPSWGLVLGWLSEWTLVIRRMLQGSPGISMASWHHQTGLPKKFPRQGYH